MADKQEVATEPTPKRSVPETVAPHTRITVAFPFSHISVQEPDDDVVEMATMIQELADLVVKAAPGAKAEELKRRAHALAARVA
jgi:hypothetical protein